MRTLFSLFCSVLAAYAALSSPICDNSAARNLGYISDSDIVAIEYFESTGEQYINTGFVAARHLSIDIDAQLMLPIVSNGFFGGQGDAGSKRHCFASTSSGYGYAIGGASYIFAGFDPFVRFHMFYDRNTLTLGVDGYESFHINNWNFLGPYPDYTLFGFNRNGEVICGNWRVYSFSCIDLSTGKSLDLIPVRIGSTGFMLDQVSELLLGNSGTGDFILGPDL